MIKNGTPWFALRITWQIRITYDMAEMILFHGNIFVKYLWALMFCVKTIWLYITHYISEVHRLHTRKSLHPSYKKTTSEVKSSCDTRNTICCSTITSTFVQIKNKKDIWEYRKPANSSSCSNKDLRRVTWPTTNVQGQKNRRYHQREWRW